MIHEHDDPQNQTPKSSLFSQLFPHPTGANGFEEIVQAAELIPDSDVLQTAYHGQHVKPTIGLLAEKRAALAEPDIQRAFVLLRAAFNKPIVTPGKINPNVLTPSLGFTSKIVRLLVTEQYVLLADGKVSAAIDGLRDALHLGQILRADSLTSGIIGVSGDSQVLESFAAHLDQLSARDCARLIALVKDYLNQPDAALESLEVERRDSLTTVEEFKKDYSAALQKWQLLSSADSTTSEWSEAQKEAGMADVQTLMSDSGARAIRAEALMGRVNLQFDTLITQFQQPTKAVLPPAPTHFLPEILLDNLYKTNRRIVSNFSICRTKVQLLGVHASIRGYRWEHNALPDNLTILRPKGLEIDPFSNEPFLYQRKENKYTLASVGALGWEISKDGNSWKETGKRVPLTLPSTPSKTIE